MSDEEALLGELGAALHGATLPADVVEEQLTAVAKRLGLDAQFFALQSFLAMEVRNGAPHATVRRMSFDTHWNLTRMTALLTLSRELAAGRVGVAEGRRRIAEIAAQRPPYGKALVVAAYGVYGGAVAARVGGNLVEVLVGALVGAVAGLIHFGTLRSNTVDLQKSFIAAFVGSLCAFVLARVLPPFDAPRAVFGGVTLLVPAMVLTVGVHELASEEVESGVVRTGYGLLRFAMLAVGIGAAVNVTRFAADVPRVTATPLPFPAVLALVALGGLALVACLQGPRRDAGAIVAAAVLAYAAQEVTKRIVGEHGAPMLSAFVLGTAAYLHAHATGRSLPVMMVPGLLQLAPGFLGTEAVLRLIGREPSSQAEELSFFRVMIIAVQLGTGLLIAGLLFRTRRAPHGAGQARGAAGG